MSELTKPTPEATVSGEYLVLRFSNGMILAIHAGSDMVFRPENGYEIAASGGFARVNVALLDGYGTVLDEDRRVPLETIGDKILVASKLPGDPEADKVFAEKRFALKRRPTFTNVGGAEDE